jgi:fatty-acyl-CoA synthase
MNYTLAALQRGGVAVVPTDVPDPLYPEVVERYRISGAFITVPNYYRLLDGIKQGSYDVSSLRALMVAGSPVSPKRLAEGLERLGPVVFNGYGQTEAGGLSMLSPREIAADGRLALTSVGKLYPQVELSLRDENGTEVAPGAAGEVFVRAPWQTFGYWCMPDESAEVYVDGWIRTRDLGYVDEHGYLHLEGRTRDVIIVNALNHYAGPIEAALARHESVAEAYVTGAPDERTGEAIHAFVVPATSTVDTELLKSIVATDLGEASVPADITVITSVPMAASGKPDKKALLALR